MGGRAGLFIRKHDHCTPTREIRRRHQGSRAHNHPEGRFSYETPRPLGATSLERRCEPATEASTALPDSAEPFPNPHGGEARSPLTGLSRGVGYRLRPQQPSHFHFFYDGSASLPGYPGDSLASAWSLWLGGEGEAPRSCWFDPHVA